MNKQDVVEKEYRLKRRNYEEREEDLLHQKESGIAVLEEVQERSNYYLRDFVPEQDILTQGLRKLDRMKEEISETVKVEQKELTRKIDELDESHRSQLRRLNQKEEREETFE